MINPKSYQTQNRQKQDKPQNFLFSLRQGQFQGFSDSNKPAIISKKRLFIDLGNSFRRKFYNETLSLAHTV
jgi:hypothetical protein